MPTKKLTPFFLFAALLFIVHGNVQSQKTYTYESVKGDPFDARIYTLDNGLKVYFSIYPEEPRIQTFIAVRVGSKNDPAETTGLAHYFEHMMFKGTPNFGTTDWEKEKVLIQEIEELFEVYRQETDLEKRSKIYKQIDSISYVASTLAIPNEYDKLMTAIGSQGTNAGTSNDYTIYIENIPSNQIENWAKIQADRFSHPVLRLFHTELETVYEEKNMSLTNDSRKASEAMMQGLFPNHPYGKQTTLGEAEHLKNPSMKNIRRFFDTFYVPNNMAVIMAGDFDPDKTIEIVDKYFGQLKPGKFPELLYKPELPITSPVVKEVVGLEAESVQIAWRFEGSASDQIPYLDMISMILYNGKSGLIDLNLNKQMATLDANAWLRSLTDYSALTLYGRNKAGQSLEEVKDLLLAEVEKLKKGDFPDWLMDASINNLKLQEMRRTESARSRAYLMMNSFLNKKPWEQTVDYVNTLSKISKEDVIKFANDHLGDNNYVVVYKRQGQPGEIAKVEKPPITPIFMNRDAESEMLKKIKATEVTPIEPVFLDYSKDFQRQKLSNGIEILYIENTENPTFSLTYTFPMGSYHDKNLPFASSFIDFLGTKKMSSEDISNEFYKLACNFSIRVNDEETRITLSGLSENLKSALILFEDLLMNARGNKKDLEAYIQNVKKSRLDSKANQRSNFQALVNYATYGPENPSTNTLSNEELEMLTVDKLITTLQQLWRVEHTIVFYGPQTLNELVNLTEIHHKVPKTLASIEQTNKFIPKETEKEKVYFAHYEANQSYLQTISKGIPFDKEIIPLVNMYNTYFGGGMNAIVFQEMREKRGLAYSSSSAYRQPSTPDGFFMNTSFIATQNDKVIDAFEAFNELFKNIPLSENAFKLAKDQIITDIRTQRITKSGIIFSYLNDKKMGYESDRRKILYENIPGMTLKDVETFNKNYIKEKPKTYVILGHRDQVDFKEIETRFGPVIKLTESDLFIY
ncbi:MAG TPA: insulinase family protein [Bacteroidales bacterium]|nr:insulinase family protein [Bacteroidales bacterium]HPR56970.1 insulinase family protein [Bacteroidales bacterium]